MRKIMASALCICCVAVMLSGCTGGSESKNLMTGIKAQKVQTESDTRLEKAGCAADFALDVLNSVSSQAENVLISPYSLLSALGMTANGAEGQTLEQMQSVLKMDVQTLNSYIHDYTAMLESGKDYKFTAANSIWINDSAKLNVNSDFLQANDDWYGAGVFNTPFNNGALEDINSWISDATDGMIPKALNDMSPDSVMYLINAVCFDGKWEEKYEIQQVRNNTFTNYDGSATTAEFMYSEENMYLSDGGAKGVMKRYKGGKYAVAALLPEEGAQLEDYIASLTGEKLVNILSCAEDVPVDTAIPKFESDYSAEMSDVFRQLGMTDAFDAASADLTGIGESEKGNLFINRILHRTHISVDPDGTKAAGATVIEIDAGCAEPPEERQTVYLNRPFLYMIVDCETNTPIFMGTVIEL